MRIALVGPVYPYRGGISQFTSLLASELAEKDDVLVVSWKRQYPRWLYPGSEQTAPGSSPAVKASAWFVLDYLNPLSWLRAGITIRRWRPDSVLFNWATTFSAPVYLVLALVLRSSRRRPLLAAICHNVLPHEPRPLDRLITRTVLGTMDACVLHAEAEQESLRQLAPRQRAISLFLPDFAPIVPKPSGGAELKRRLGLGARVVLFFGHVRRYKGLRYLLDAVPMVLRDVDIDVLVAGEFWDDKRQYLEQIERAGIRQRVKIVDEYLPDSVVPAYFDAADVVVLPYVTASQSAVIQLAHGLGKPVISTAVGGIPEVVRDGETGLLVDPQDADALARAIVRFFREDLGRAFSERIRRDRERFSWRHYTEAIRSFVSGRA
jgi:glycosyltransferase involved in cell wall biosynthesis